MATMLTKLSPMEVRARLDGGTAVLVDIREADEFARLHIDGARSQPLSGWEWAHLNIESAADVIFTCRSGVRTAGACERLAQRVSGRGFVLEGGIEAWRRAELPLVTNPRAPLEIMRQVQIAAGTLILMGAALGAAVAPAWFALPAFVGAGLLLARATGFCGMARVLALAPWNRGDPAT